MFADLIGKARRKTVGLYISLKRDSSKRKIDSYPNNDNQSGLLNVSALPLDRMLGCRHELKYCISESKAEAIAQFIKPYLHLDRYCKAQPSGVYPISSLYLDSKDLQLCRESLEGHKNRFKLRIRSYNDDPDYPHFFEIKRRMNTIIIKSRAPVLRQDIAAFLSGLSLPARNYYSIEKDALNQFRLYMNSIGAGPVIRIRYMRQAFEDDSDNRVRVTFDRQLDYIVGSNPDVGVDGQGWQRNSLEAVILEIKFSSRYPAWLSRMIRTHPKTLRRRITIQPS